MAELIKTTDSLNDGRKKLNDAITDSNAALSTANTAKQTANLAKAESESTQTQLDTIVIEGDSSVEAAQARVNNSGTAFPTLKQRLDAEHQEVTAQLQQKATKDELQQISLAFKESYDTLALLQAAYPAGDAYNHTVKADGLIYTYRNGWVSTGIQANGTGVANGTITQKKLAFPALQGVKSLNLFDKNAVTKGFYISAGGTIVANGNYNISDYIPVKPLTAYSVHYKDQLAIFDANKVRIDGSNNIVYTHTVLTMPANAAFIRLSVPNPYLADYRFTEGADLKPYTPYEPAFDVNSIREPIPLSKLDPVLSASQSSNFNDSIDRMILPPRMYFIKEINLPLYKQGFLTSDKFYDDMKTAVNYIDWNTSPPNVRINYFGENIMLESPTIETNSLLINMRTKHKPDFVYERGIARSVVPKSKLTGLSFKVLNIGDSLTQNQVAVKTKEKLNSLGANVTLTGTKVGGIEGRGSWAFTHFIGRSSTIEGNYMPIYTPGDVMDNWKNPFLKLATEADKTNNPTWCFRHSPAPGVQVEKSYAEDTDKTGDFYIFDFAYYLSAHGLATPDIITIALGTNDVNLANMRLGLYIMIKQIKKALPNVKIGVVPQPSVGSTTLGEEKFKTMAVWIENAMTDITNLQLTYNNLHVIPAWCHINRDFVFDYGTTTDLSTVNKVQRRQRTEFIHANDLGISEYVNVLVSFIANVI